MRVGYMHRTIFKKNPSLGQAILEYLLLLSLVAFLALLAFRPSGIIQQTQQVSADYFDTGARAIMGPDYGTLSKTGEKNPQKINGGWCQWTECIDGYKTRECACPRPAFGGAECAGSATQSCS